jgi:hypothetical protein
MRGVLLTFYYLSDKDYEQELIASIMLPWNGSGIFANDFCALRRI